MLMIPFGIAAVLELIAELIIGAVSVSGVLTVVGVGLGESILFFGIATIVAFFCGHIVALPALYLFFNFIIAYFQLIVENYADGFLYGIDSDITAFDCLSPLIYLMDNVEHKVKYDNGTLVSTSLDNWYSIPIYAFVGLVLLVLAALLYKKRKSESAGDIIAFKPVKNVMLVLVTGSFGLGMGSFLYEIYTLNGSSEYKAVPVFICLLISVAIGYYITKMILERTIRVFNKKNAVGFIIAAVLTLIFVVSLDCDVCGLEKKLPDINDISAVTFSSNMASGNNITFNRTAEPEEIERVLKIHKAAIDSKDIYLAEEGKKETTVLFVRVRLEYKLNNGSTLERTYEIPIDEAYKNTECARLFNELMNTRKVMLINYGIQENSYFSEGEISSIIQGTYENFSVKQGNAVVEAITRDIDEGNIGSFDYDACENENGYVLYLNIETVSYTTGERAYAYFNLSSDMKNTIETLLAIDAIKESDLILKKDYFGDDYYSYKDYDYMEPEIAH